MQRAKRIRQCIKSFEIIFVQSEAEAIFPLLSEVDKDLPQWWPQVMEICCTACKSSKIKDAVMNDS